MKPNKCTKLPTEGRRDDTSSTNSPFPDPDRCSFPLYLDNRMLQRQQYAAASEFLQKGIRVMVSKQQYSQANELFLLLIEVFNKSPDNASLGVW